MLIQLIMMMILLTIQLKISREKIIITQHVRFSNNEFICSLNLLKLIVDELILCHFAKLLTINIQMHKSNYQSIDKIIIEFNK